MADKDLINTKVQTDSHVQMAAATGASPLTSINRDFEEKATQEKAQQMGMNYIDIEHVHINPDHLKVLTFEEAKKSGLIPFFKIGKKVRLAVIHPTAPETQEAIRKLKADGYAINVNLASQQGMEKAFLFYSNQQVAAPIVTENLVEISEIESYQKEIEGLAGLRTKIQEVTAEEALNFINVGAIKTGASDIHYQPEEKRVIVRFRIDGVLQQVLEIDQSTYGYISNQLKYKSGMRLNVTNVPQDGRYFFKVNQRKIDVRVSSIPTEYGESFVCRLLDSASKNLEFTQMGFEGRNLAILNASLQIPNGMILVTGPTGSGKTTTLYSLLNKFNSPDNKIITLEDPIEYHLANITQSQINEKRGYTFGGGLRAILRQDPDIVMIGEIRDSETAETAAQAALTGHIMLSTLHTNSAIETIPRLLNIGLKPFMIAPALNTVIAQRLVRKVCSFCAVQKPLTQSERQTLEVAVAEIQKISPDLALNIPATLPHAPGCEKCSNTGFLGQVCIAEMFINDDELKDKILQGVATGQLYAYARSKGMLSMGEDGVLKVLRGLTTLEEIERVTDISAAVTRNKIESGKHVNPTPERSEGAIEQTEPNSQLSEDQNPN